MKLCNWIRWIVLLWWRWWIIWLHKNAVSVIEVISKNFRTGCLERELQIVQLSATRCSCIAILWASLVSFATMTLCVASQRVFIIVAHFVIDSVRKLLVTPSYVNPPKLLPGLTKVLLPDSAPLSSVWNSSCPYPLSWSKSHRFLVSILVVWSFSPLLVIRSEVSLGVTSLFSCLPTPQFEVIRPTFVICSWALTPGAKYLGLVDC
jgi:hypothetical protein